MQVFPRAIAQVARRYKAQFLLELPDEVPVRFARAIVEEANKLAPSGDLIGVAAYDARKDVGTIEGSCNFRELAKRRHGSKLIVAYSGDYKSWSTYSGVFPKLFGASFPMAVTQTGDDAGQVDLKELGHEVASILLTLCSDRLAPAEMREAVSYVLDFLGHAYSIEGNTNTAWTTRWWLHIDRWLEEMARAVADNEDKDGDVGLIPLLYGAAGLPRPNQGAVYGRRVEAGDYCRIVHDRWSSPSDVSMELDRLEHTTLGAEAAHLLRKLPWDVDLDDALLENDCLVSAVTGVGSESSRSARLLAWASLPEDAFFSQPTSSDELAIFRNGQELPRPWPDAVPFLPTGSSEVVSTDPWTIELADVALVIPISGEITQAESDVLSKLTRRNVALSFSAGKSEITNVLGVQRSGQSLALSVSLRLTLDRPPAGFQQVRLTVRGPAARLTGDLLTTRVCLLLPREIALLNAPGGPTRGKGAKASVHRRQDDEDTVAVTLRQRGLRRFAIFLGPEALATPEEISIAPASSTEVFSKNAGSDRMLTTPPVSVYGGQSINAGGVRLFELEVDDASVRPLSPLAAACLGARASTELRSDVIDLALGRLEVTLVQVLRSMETHRDTSQGLGHIAVSSTRSAHEVRHHASGIMTSDALANSIARRYPAPPTGHLVQLPSYSRLVNAYVRLNIPKRISDLEQEESTSGIIPSRLSFRDIPKADIDELLEAYCQLLDESNSAGSAEDQFWAKFPMSVVVYSDKPGKPNCLCVLLSCLHPIRLAWRWELETAFACVFEEAGNASDLAKLTEGWTFPTLAAFRTSVNGVDIPLVSVPIHLGPEQVFIGWSALATVPLGAPSEPELPEWLNGARFPAGAASGLSDTAVLAAMRDFVKVFPQVRTLNVDLPVPQPTPRSKDIDDAIGHALEALVLEPGGEWSLPGGIRVRDSSWRLGSVPEAGAAIPVSESGKPVRKFSWTVLEGDIVSEANQSHIRFAQTQSTLVTVGYEPTGGAAMPLVPIRRFPLRRRTTDGIATNYTMAALGALQQPFVAALAKCEGWQENKSPVVTIIPGAAFQGLSSADWMVSGDFGLDPTTLQALALGQGKRRMLWEWRPAIATRGQRNRLLLEQRPYVTVSRVPPGVSTSLRDKVALLLPAGTGRSSDECVDEVIRTLAERGIGLNSLLAMGYHHATGALGFYFALKLLSQWTDRAPQGVHRVVVPVDAVDPLLRSIVGGAESDSRRLADLLAVEVHYGSGTSTVRIVPIEVKHYGLNDDETSSAFPVPGSGSLAAHVDQLVSYGTLLRKIAEVRKTASDTHAAMIDCALCAVLDAAGLLNPRLLESGPGLVQSVMAASSYELQIGKGLLLWFQKDGGVIDNITALWQKVDEQSPGEHAEMFVDPVKASSRFWSNTAEEPLEELVSGLSWCMSDSVTSEGAVVTPTATVVDTPPAESARLPIVNVPASTEVVPSVSGANPNTASAGKDTELGEVATTPVARGLGKDELSKRYRNILVTLKEFNVSVEAPASESERYSEGPASIVFAIRPGHGVAVGRVEAQLNNLKLRLRLERDQEIGSFVERGLVKLDVPKADQERYFVSAQDVWKAWGLTGDGFPVPIGEDRTGQIVAIDFASANSPHLLIAGTTGSGKSEALLTLLMSAAHYYIPAELQLLLVDPKGTELRPFEGSPHVLGSIGYSPADAIGLMDKAIVEMERRYKLFRESSAGARSLSEFNKAANPEDLLPRWMVVLDEYADLTSETPDKKELEERLKRLAAKARAAGIHLVVSTQKPTTEVINTVIRSNLPAQLALKTKTTAESIVIMGEKGAETLTGKGDAFFKVGNLITRVQCAKV